jgi:prepilin-type N-terminal cleavage/methylation domain-containing protein
MTDAAHIFCRVKPRMASAVLPCARGGPPIPSVALHGKRRGFTLIEVLATLVLLGIVVPVAMRGVSIALAAATTARRTAEAATLADAKLNELIADGSWQTSGTTGNFAPDHPEYTWTCENVSRDYGTNEVVLHVKWMQRGAEKVVSISTLVYQSAYDSGSTVTTGGSTSSTGGGG